MFTTVAFQESVDPAGVFNDLTAVPDQHITVSGDDLRVPSLNQIIAAAFGVDVTVEAFARLSSPSLRIRQLLHVEPFNTASAAAVEPGSPHRIYDLRRSPIALVVGENLNASVQSDPLAAQIQWAVVWLADGAPDPIRGAIFTARATAAQALVASTWTNGALTFVEDLPRGRYQVVGMRARAAGLVAARLVFVGAGALGWRPGVLGTDAQDDQEHMMFRHGELGAWGEFEDIEPPTVDFLSVSADAAEDVYLDLIQTRAGPG
ncbi:MAG: hypothetical protein ACREKK_00430 [Candidatus Methylomirabilales bacterium]